jgi:hypothetical protein
MTNTSFHLFYGVVLGRCSLFNTVQLLTVLFMTKMKSNKNDTRISDNWVQ